MNKEIIFEIKNIKKWFPMKKNIKDYLSSTNKYIKAVDGISFKVYRGETFGIIGESGCGKSTTARLINGTHELSDGEIIFNGNSISKYNRIEKKEYKKKVQMIFQDPYSSMNPRFKINDILEEPFLIHNIKEKKDESIKKIMEKVNLIPVDDFLTRYPHMLSGGQRQRVATARALMLNPDLIIADEPVSMIDISTKAQILEMFNDIKKELNLTYIYITHDLSTAKYFTDRIAVMYLGVIVEMGDSNKILSNAKHPYTKALIASISKIEKGNNKIKKEIPIKGEIPSAVDIPKGCRFHKRCIYAKDICREIGDFSLKKIEDEHYSSCIRYNEI